MIAAAVVIVLIHNGSDSDNARRVAAHSHSHTTNAPGAKQKGTVAVNPTKVTVAVLNGPSPVNLAADVSARLGAKGFQSGGTGNFNDQTQSTTVVGYLPGQRAEALAVAKALSTGSKSVASVSSTARALICTDNAANCPVDVVVVVGADLDSDADAT